MAQLEILVKDPQLSRLEGLVGGKLVADKVSGDPSDPDEDSTLIAGVTFPDSDKIDVLEAYLKMDSTVFGIMTRRVSTEDLHRCDAEAIRLDRISQERANRGSSLASKKGVIE